MPITERTRKGWDESSGVRERLAFLAQLGPSVDPSDWGYDPSRDTWYYCGQHDGRPFRLFPIKQEGSASLDLISKHWKLDRRSAMALIDYPEV